MAKITAICCFLLIASCQSACSTENEGACPSDEAALVQKTLQLHNVPVATNLKETSTHVSEAISLALFLDKAEARLKMAKELNAQIKPSIDFVLGAMTYYHDSKTKSHEEMEMMTDGITAGWEKIAAAFDSKVKEDAGTEMKYREELVAALDNMEHEGEFGDKLRKFGVKWGENKLLGDLSDPVLKNRGTVLNAVKEYREAAKDGFNDKAFGKMFKTASPVMMTAKMNMDVWEKVGVAKLQEVKDAAAKYTSHSRESLNDAIWQQVAMEKAEERAALARRLNDKFRPLGDKMLADSGTYKGSAHSEEDFKNWNMAVLKPMDDMKADLESEIQRAASEKEEAMKGLNKALDKLEDEGEFAKKLTMFTSAWGRDKLCQDLLAAVKGKREQVAKDLQTFKEKTTGRKLALMNRDSPDDKLFGQAYGSVNNAAIGLMNSFGTWTISGYTKIGELSEGYDKVLKPYEKA